MKFRFALMIHSVIFALILAWSTAAICASPEPRLLKDIDVTAGNSSSDPTGFISLGAFTYFAATDGGNGRELWKTDGTEVGTVLVKNIWPGTGYSTPVLLTNVNGTLFFAATNGANGYELWKSDGTETGTMLMKDINPGVNSSTPLYLTNLNGTLFFAAFELTHGTELWKSDGTEAGTVLVKDIWSGSGASSPKFFINLNGTLIFTANDGTSGQELWKSDGTETGTMLVKDIWPGAGGSNPEQLTNVNGTLFFVATQSNNVKTLWKSDGTEAGTMLVKDFYPGTSYPNISSLTDVNGTLFFTADDGIHGIELWRSDGTETGTVLVKDMYTGITGSYPANLTNVNGTLYFSVSGPTNAKQFFLGSAAINGSVLWKSDGTEAGTVPVKDAYPGSGSLNPTNLTNVNGTLYFTANNGIDDRELWKSDGTAAGTVLVKDIYPGTGSSNPTNLTNLNGTLYFSATDPTHGTEVWVLAPPAASPTATTGMPSSVAINSATLTGTVSDGGATTTVSFEYGLDTSYGNNVSAGTVTANSGVTPVSALISGLACGTGYHYRIVATNSTATVSGSDSYLVTLPCPMPPSVATGAASAISTTGATLNGTAYSFGSIATVTFDYGQTSAYGSTVTVSNPPADSGNGAVSAAVTGLSCGTSYHYRIRGENFVGTSNGEDVSFTTTACPPPGSVIISTIAGNGTTGFNGDGAAATSAGLYYPNDVAIDSSGNIYIADTFNYRIRKLSIDTGIISTVAGISTSGFSGDGLLATASEINAPYGVSVDDSGNIYIADTYNHRIRRVDAVTGSITTVAGNGSAAFSGDGGPATSASLNNPRKVIVDKGGNIYIADTNNNRIRMVDASSGIITTVAGNGSGAFAGDGGAATSASIYWPYSVAIDNSGNLYIADYSNMRIRKVEKATGIISTVAGKGGTGYITFSGEGGPATSASIGTPYGVTVDVVGNIYLAASYRILKVDTVTGILNTVAGSGLVGFSGDGGLATTADLDGPSGIAIDTAGSVYFADTRNHRIRKIIAPDLTITMIAATNGAISGPLTINFGGSANYTITPASGYHVADVLVDGVSIGAVTSYTLNKVTTNHSISATFAINTFTITATAGANGSLSGPATINYGSNATYTIIPATGYHIADVQVDGVSVGAVTSYTLTNITTNHTISSAFAINTFTITATAGANGSLSGPATINYGSNATYTIIPATGYHIADVQVDGVSVGAVTSYTLTNITTNHTISSTFAINTFAITATAGPNGGLSGPATVNYGGNAVYTITPATGYRVAGVVVDGTSIAPVNTYQFNNVTSNHTISATFITLADLAIASINGPTITIRGKRISVSSVINNQGGSNTGSFTVALYLSKDHLVTSSDTLLGTMVVPSLNAGSTVTISGSFTVPSKMATGAYYIGVIADSGFTVTESNEANNSKAAKRTLYVM